MKRVIMAATVVGAMALAGNAAAQSAVKLNMEDSHAIKETVLKDLKIPHARAGTFETGDPAPADATLREFPAELTSRISQLKGYSFFVAGDQVVVVSTSDKKIADVIK